MEKYKDKKYKDIIYLIFHKFLRENCILEKYLLNSIKAGRSKGTAKEMIQRQIDNYIKLNPYDASSVAYFNNLYSDGSLSFYWESTDEGTEFWMSYDYKWVIYLNDKIEKYNL